MKFLLVLAVVLATGYAAAIDTRSKRSNYEAELEQYDSDSAFDRKMARQQLASLLETMTTQDVAELEGFLSGLWRTVKKVGKSVLPVLLSPPQQGPPGGMESIVQQYSNERNQAQMEGRVKNGLKKGLSGTLNIISKIAPLLNPLMEIEQYDTDESNEVQSILQQYDFEGMKDNAEAREQFLGKILKGLFGKK